MEKMANNFYDWLIALGYRDEDDKSEDIEDVMEDLSKMKDAVPRMFNVLKEICDRLERRRL